jgi:hypothetical protein
MDAAKDLVNIIEKLGPIVCVPIKRDFNPYPLDSVSILPTTVKEVNKEKQQALLQTLCIITKLELQAKSPYYIHLKEQIKMANIVCSRVLRPFREDINNGKLWRIGHDVYTGVIRTAEEFLGWDLSKFQFFCPSTQKSRTGGMKAVNIEERIYLVVEFDKELLDKDHQATFIWYLREKYRLQLVCVTDSGKKSLHALFFVLGVDRKIQTAMLDEAIELGADWKFREARQWTRMPGGSRRNAMGQKLYLQSVIYFDPDFASKNLVCG